MSSLHSPSNPLIQPSLDQILALRTSFINNLESSSSSHKRHVVSVIKKFCSSSSLVPSPTETYLAVKDSNYSFLLETSSIDDSQKQQYSIIAGKAHEILRFSNQAQNNASIKNEMYMEPQDPLLHIEKCIKDIVVMKEACWTDDKISEPLPSIVSGAIVGYISYDCVKYFEPKLNEQQDKEDVIGLPESLFMFSPNLITFSHYSKNIYISSNFEVDLNNEQNVINAYRHASQEIEKLEKKIASIQTLNLQATNNEDDQKQEHQQQDDVYCSHLYMEKSESKIEENNQQTEKIESQHFKHQGANYKGLSNVGEEGYKGFVRYLKERIVDGDCIQVVPSQRIQRKTSVHPFNIYRQLRILNPSRYMFYIECNDFEIVGASPELLLKVSKNIGEQQNSGKSDKFYVVTHPIAGTRPRGKTEEEDLANENDLKNDIKEVSEHVMLVDLGRNDINRVCEPSSTTVSHFMRIERYSHVMHIVSEVIGEKRRECSSFDAFRSVFPAGTVSGAPKVKAMQLIKSIEPSKRNIYAGALGYFAFDGSLDTCIALRTLVNKGDYVYLQAGGGIVYDSNEHDEYMETIHKMGSLARAIDLAEKEQEEMKKKGRKGIKQISQNEQNEQSDYYGFESKVIMKGEESQSNQSNESHQPSSSLSSIHGVDHLDSSISNDITLLIDNYDSFTWNIYQYLCELGGHVIVYRNDISLEECKKLNPARVVVSPGPGWPKDSGISIEAVKYFSGKVPLLGVCMGHECIVEAFDGEIVHCGEIVHGKTSLLKHDGKGVYQGISPQTLFPVTRYHSLAANPNKVPKGFIVSAQTENGIIMGLRHETFKIEGLQYHPESIMSQHGKLIIKNFLAYKSPLWEEN